MKDNKTNELAEVMFQVFRLMKERMSYTSKLTHLSVLQIHTLVYLMKNENVAMSDIAEHFNIELPSATSLLNKLYEQNLVVRNEDKKDRRLVRIKLTSDGKKLVKQAMRERCEKLEFILSHLSEKERTELLAILKTLYSRLKE